MTRVSVVCDGAVRPSGAEAADTVIPLSHGDARANVNLTILSPVHALGSPVDPISSDLLKVAAYAYSADKDVSRGGITDLYGSSWQREFTVYMPVSSPDLWEACADLLSETLEFLSGDKWLFRFSQAEPTTQQVPLEFDPAETMQNPDCVCLVSGGLDSLCAAVEKVREGRRPVLVRHSPAFNIRNRVSTLVREMRGVFSNTWSLPYVSAAVSRSDGRDPKENTQRTRSFLYSTLASVFAERLKLKDVFLADNGIVSLNLPISPQLAGTLASRSTHPKFIRLFNELLAGLFNEPPVLSNPLWSRTRAETLSILDRPELRSLVSFTTSCVHTRLQVRGKRHCGVCSQCIDRRFATLAAGLEAQDSVASYVTDVFRDSIKEGPDRTMVLSYHGFALRVSTLSGEDLFRDYSELYECVVATSLAGKDEAQALADMIHRHADTVIKVTEEQVVAAKAQIARRELPPDCLLSLLGRGGDVPAAPSSSNGFEHSEDYTAVLHHGRPYTFTRAQAEVVKYLDDLRQRGPPATRHKPVLTHLQLQGLATPRLRDLFRGSDVFGTLIISPKKGVIQLAD